MLGRFAGQIHLNEHARARAGARRLDGDRPKQIEAIDRMNPREVRDRFPGLVGLEMADEMPFERETLEGGDLAERFLNAILAKGAVAGLVRGPDIVRAEGL